MAICWGWETSVCSRALRAEGGGLLSQPKGCSWNEFPSWDPLLSDPEGLGRARMRPQAGSWPYPAPWWPWAQEHRVSGGNCWEWSGQRERRKTRGGFSHHLCSSSTRFLCI